MIVSNATEIRCQGFKSRLGGASNHRYAAERLKKNRYHEGRGKRLKRYGDGWTDHGREYYQQLLGIFKNLQVSDVWNTLQDYWKMYQKKQYNKGNDNQVDEVGGHDEEYDESDK